MPSILAADGWTPYQDDPRAGDTLTPSPDTALRPAGRAPDADRCIRCEGRGATLIDGGPYSARCHACGGAGRIVQPMAAAPAPVVGRPADVPVPERLALGDGLTVERAAGRLLLRLDTYGSPGTTYAVRLTREQATALALAIMDQCDALDAEVRP